MVFLCTACSDKTCIFINLLNNLFHFWFKRIFFELDANEIKQKKIIYLVLKHKNKRKKIC